MHIVDELSRWQDTFAGQYLHDRPPVAILTAAVGTGKTRAAIRAWERLHQDLHFENLVVVTDGTILNEQWTKRVRELHDQLPAPPKNFLVRSIQGLKGEVAEQIKTLYTAGKTLVIVDEAHKFTTELRRKQLSSLQNGPTGDSQLLYLNIPFQEINGVSPFRVDPDIKEYLFDPILLREDLILTDIAHFSPSYGLFHKSLTRGLILEDLSWRNFEKLIRDLLESDGYTVELMKGTKDGGIDVIAIKKDPVSGFYQTVWQAKKYNKMKVGLHLIRELADSVRELKASKGIIVTTSFLTKGALDRVERDKYTLGKVDRDDLKAWIDRTLYK